MSLTEQHLDELERLAQEATRGPWVQATATRVVSVAELERLERDNEEAPLVASVPVGSPDGPFLAAARTAVPLLVAEVRRLRAALGLTLEGCDLLIEATYLAPQDIQPLLAPAYEILKRGRKALGDDA